MDSERTAGLRWRLVRPLFETLYRSRTLYWLASTIPFAGQWRVWQRLVVPRLRGHDVLEVGCGIGTLLADMVAAGYACAAIDRSEQMVAAARRELRRRHPAFDAARIQQADARRLPFGDASFDSVVSTFPTDYIYQSRTLAEIARVLRPDGRLIIVLGAALLPKHALLLPLVAVQSLVYGSSAHAARTGTDASASDSSASISGSDMLCTRLAAAGLTPHTELVTGPFWVASLTIAEKSDCSLA